MFRARGILPPGNVGEHDFAEIFLESGDLVSRMNDRTLGKDPQDEAVSLQIDDFSINGTIPNVYDQGMVFARFAKFKSRDLIQCWIAHLQLCAMVESYGLEKQSVYLPRDVSAVFDPPDNCRDILKQLLEVYWEGLFDPLPFFPKSAYKYAHTRLVQNKPREEALKAAISTLQGNKFSPGEIEEPYNHFYFDGTAALNKKFESTALILFEPLFGNYTSTPYKPTLQLKDLKYL